MNNNKTVTYLVPLLTLTCLCSCLNSCIGKYKRKPVGALPESLVQQAINAFSLIEHTPVSPLNLPEWLPDTHGHSMRLAIPAPGSCITYKSSLNPDGSTTVTHSFACASQKDGSTLAGDVAFTFTRGTDSYRVEYKSLKLVQGTTSWTINGTKRIQLHKSAQQATISTPTPLTIAIMDTKTPTNSQSYSYGCRMMSDYKTPQLHRLWGTFSFQAGADPILKGTIAPGEALRWDNTAPSCHPSFGKIRFNKGSNTTTAAFYSNEGTYSLSNTAKPAVYKLPDCYK